VNFQNMH